MPQRRRSGRGAVVVVFGVFAAIILVVGLAAYFADYKPRHYVQDWGDDLLAPTRWNRGETAVDGHKASVEFTASCGLNCGADIPRNARDWVNQNGFTVSETDMADCFRRSCFKQGTRSGHDLELSVTSRTAGPTGTS